ncbi:MAG: PHB depolymerase family esterase [Myxococcota bacterium]|nr:PHB depolymerase family esterase [Myxococcota bacterium]
MTRRIFIFLIISLSRTVSGCGDDADASTDGNEETDTSTAADAGSDSDTDTDSDSDTDTDSDSDTDTDSDSDTDTDSDSDMDTDSDSDTGTDTGTDTDSQGDCPVDGDIGAGQHNFDIQFEGRDRDYIAVVPEIYDPSMPTALVINMHGYSSNAFQQTIFSNMNPTAEARGFIVLYPNGFENSWNGGACCGEAAEQDLNDVGLMGALVDDVSTKLCIDRKRVYATGMSNGGYMSHRLACEGSDLFAAVAPVAGALGISDCTPPRPMPVLAFNGMEDNLVNYDSGKAAIEHWLASNGCSDTPATETFNDSYCETYADCNDGISVVFCSMTPMGHCWPGGSEFLCILSTVGPYNDDINANDYMWEFFKQFALP